MNEPELVAELDAGNVALPLKQPHRDAMLALVLAWGTLDGALAMLLATIMGKPYHETADLIGKQNGSAKLAEITRLIKGHAAAEATVKFLKRHKKNYEKYSVPRNRIAHGRCAGYLTRDENYIVFLVFERVGERDLAVDAVPLEELVRARRWGEAFTAWIFQALERLQSTE